ncbi:MAG: multicopper oxidase family protein [Fibrobacterota bacterium]|nr:multicopper oxidase domain-containing protein [Chitinispirillaceae bacterium]
MRLIYFSLLFFSSVMPIAAKVIQYELTVDERLSSPAGKTVKALTINGTLPGPTLRFTIGDTARITVINHLKREETSIHWHGLLVPYQQDGVPYLTTAPIYPGASHVFEFELKHTGTYWYHSHTGLQEQRGVYGSIVVDPATRDTINNIDREFVVVLSDWTNERPSVVSHTLMRGNEWYAIKKNNAQSLAGSIKAHALRDYLEQLLSRMPSMDISDVYYNKFLANGKDSIVLPAQAGERILLRVINAAASSYFYLGSATGLMTIIAADGPAVVPADIRRLLIATAETYDLIVTVPDSGSYEVRATAQDGSGHASIFLGSGTLHRTEDPPKANLYTMDEMLDGALQSSRAIFDTVKERPQAPYQLLRAPQSTAFDTSHPVRTIELRMTGSMRRYIWSFDGKTLDETDAIKIAKGEIVRLVLINNTMMNHPLHLHGHFFRVINGMNDFAPLKHTVDIPPMGRRIIEFEANEVGDWFFHCHLLYHMHMGMARVFSYKEMGENHKPDLGNSMKPMPVLMMGGAVLHSMTMGMMVIMYKENDVYFNAMTDYSLSGHHEAEIGYRRFVGENFSFSLGIDPLQLYSQESGVFFGEVKYQLPFFIEGGLRFTTGGVLTVSLDNQLHLTPRLGINNSVAYTTHHELEYFGYLEYILLKNVSLIASYHSMYGAGFGIGFRL